MRQEDPMDYIHELRQYIGPRKIILNCAGALIIKDDKILDEHLYGLVLGNSNIEIIGRCKF